MEDQEQKVNPSYYAIIPASVRYDNDLTANAKLLYGEITALCSKEGYCWATNRYFGELYSVSKVSISNWISQLAEKGYVSLRDHVNADNSNQRRIYINDISLMGIKENFMGGANLLNGVSKKTLAGNKDKFNHSSTDSNTSNKQFNNKKETVSFPSIAAGIIVNLNELAGRKYKPDNAIYVKHIVARLKDGFTEQELNDIVAYKVAEWKGTVMEVNLVPDTLFNKTKANKYRDQVAHAKEKGYTANDIKSGTKQSNKWSEALNNIK